MSHFWLPNEDQAMLKAKYQDWLADLREFPAALITEACAIWRRRETRRPMPAEIRGLCVEAMPKKAKPLALPRPTAEDDEATADRIAYHETAADARERWAREHGCADFGEAIKIGLVSVGNRPLVKSEAA